MSQPKNRKNHNVCSWLKNVFLSTVYLPKRACNYHLFCKMISTGSGAYLTLREFYLERINRILALHTKKKKENNWRFFFLTTKWTSIWDLLKKIITQVVHTPTFTMTSPCCKLIITLNKLIETRNIFLSSVLHISIYKQWIYNNHCVISFLKEINKKMILFGRCKNLSPM